MLVNFLHPVALVLVIKGQEKTSWQEKSGENNRWRHHSADCFKQQVRALGFMISLSSTTLNAD